MTWEVAHALLLAGAAHNLLRDIQLELAELFDSDRNLSLPPHITMKAPFSTDDVGRHMAYLDRLGSETREIQLRLTQIELFADRTLYLGVDRAAALPPLTARMLLRRIPGEWFVARTAPLRSGVRSR